MTTLVVLVGGLIALAVLSALFGADSRDRRWSITGPVRQAVSSRSPLLARRATGRTANAPTGEAAGSDLLRTP